MGSRGPGGRLTVRLLLGFALSGVLLVLAVTGVQLYGRFDRETQRLETALDAAQRDHAAALITALWDTDQSGIRDELIAMLRLPEIDYAEVQTAEGTTIAAGLANPRYAVTHRSQLMMNEGGAVRTVGTLTLSANLAQIYPGLLSATWGLLARDAAIVGAVALCLFVVAHLTVLRHIKRIARHARHLGLAGTAETLALKRAAAIRDELSQIVAAINEVQIKLLDSHDSLRSREAALTTNIAQLNMAKRVLEERNRELEQLADDFDEAQEIAEAASRDKTAFLANLMHELRTPLNAIIGFSEILARETYGPLGNTKYRRYAVDIGKCAAHLMSMVNDMLDMSTIEIGKTDLKDEVIDVEVAVRDAMEYVRPEADAGHQALSVEMGQDLPYLKADRRALRQILLNLLSNAVKFTPEYGQVNVHSALDREGSLFIAVADSGMGIPEADIDTLLKPFGRIETGLQHERAGTGLGLPLSKSLMELHGGRLHLSSQMGYGTTVTMYFPPERVVPVAAMYRGA